jgi:hypothetical protein
MKLFTKDRTENYFESILFAINKLDEIYTSKLDKIQIEDYLEYAVRGIMNARLNVLMELANDNDNKEGIIIGSIKQLLLLCKINSIKGASKELKKFLNMKFLLIEGISDLTEMNLSSSYLESQNFLSDVNVIPGGEGDVIEIIPSRGECFDYGFMVYSKVNLKPFAVFIDTKSGKEYPEKVNNTCIDSTSSKLIQSKNNDKIKFDIIDLPNSGKRAIHLLNTTNSSSLSEINVVDGSLLQALKNKDFIYIYVNTTRGSLSFGVEYDEMQLGEVESNRVLSFFVDAHRIVRTASIVVKTEEI